MSRTTSPAGVRATVYVVSDSKDVVVRLEATHTSRHPVDWKGGPK